MTFAVKHDDQAKATQAQLFQLMTLLLQKMEYPRAYYLDVACIGASLIVQAIAIAPADHRQSMIEVLTDYIREQAGLTE